MLTWPSPPRMCPTIAPASATRRRAMSPRTIRSPAKMKNGMAISAKTEMPLFRRWNTTTGGSPI